MYERVVQIITPPEIKLGTNALRTKILDDDTLNAPEISPWCDSFFAVDFGGSDWSDEVNSFANNFGINTLEKTNLIIDGEEKEIYSFTVNKQVLSALSSILDKRLDDLILRIEKHTRPVWHGNDVVSKYKELTNLRRIVNAPAGYKLYNDSRKSVYDLVEMVSLLGDYIDEKVYIGGILKYHW